MRVNEFVYNYNIYMFPGKIYNNQRKSYKHIYKSIKIL